MRRRFSVLVSKFHTRNGTPSQVCKVHLQICKVCLHQTPADVYSAIPSQATYAVIPKENSIYGPVIETYDLLRGEEAGTSKFIREVITVEIKHCLVVRRDVKLEDVHRIVSHEQVCRSAMCPQGLNILLYRPWVNALHSLAKCLITSQLSKHHRQPLLPDHCLTKMTYQGQVPLSVLEYARRSSPNSRFYMTAYKMRKVRFLH